MAKTKHLLPKYLSKAFSHSALLLEETIFGRKWGKVNFCWRKETKFQEKQNKKMNK